MAIELFDAVNTDGLFDIVGKAFGALDVLNTAWLTTVPANVTNVLTFFNKLTAVDLVRERTIDHLPESTTSFQAVGPNFRRNRSSASSRRPAGQNKGDATRC